MGCAVCIGTTTAQSNLSARERDFVPKMPVTLCEQDEGPRWGRSGSLRVCRLGLMAGTEGMHPAREAQVPHHGGFANPATTPIAQTRAGWGLLSPQTLLAPCIHIQHLKGVSY